ncbi:hypothetical protein ACF1HJ_30075 [Streptomyces sp. NPDC013978]|uniref:hypothetical protein n=1 Tax=Streptomyces sp. NPDC013978 TaxID=3364869 RepID=UPI0036F61362
MASARGPAPHEPHPMFRGVFHAWHAEADVFSALPDAPVRPDDPEPWWRRLMARRRKPSMAARPRTIRPSEWAKSR